jgi:hypothetical protein
MVVADVAPAFTVEGLSWIGPTGGFTTLRDTAGDVPPPGEEFTAVSARLPAAAKSVEGSAALTSVVLMYVVARAEPLTSITVDGTKPVPVKEITADAVPVNSVVVDSDVIVGAGLSTSRSTGVLTLLPFETSTASSAPFVSWVAGTVAVRLVALTYAVASAVPPTSTRLPLTNPEPETVSVVPAAPTLTFAGLIELIVGLGVGVVVPPPPPPPPLPELLPPHPASETTVKPRRKTK